MPPDLPPQQPAAMRLHTSWRGLTGAALTPLALLAIGGVALRDGGIRTLPLILVTLGAGLLLVVLLDYPHTVRLDRQGIARIALLRTHVLRWDQLVALERTRPATTTVVHNLTSQRDHRQVSGGLVARGDKRGRRWLLTDRVESRMEYDRLVALLTDVDARVEVRAARPHAGAVPTFLYRRRDVP